MKKGIGEEKSSRPEALSAQLKNFTMRDYVEVLKTE